jgi:hypothetical protein
MQRKHRFVGRSQPPAEIWAEQILRATAHGARNRQHRKPDGSQIGKQSLFVERRHDGVARARMRQAKIQERLGCKRRSGAGKADPRRS